MLVAAGKGFDPAPLADAFGRDGVAVEQQADGLPDRRHRPPGGRSGQAGHAGRAGDAARGRRRCAWRTGGRASAPCWARRARRGGRHGRRRGQPAGARSGRRHDVSMETDAGRVLPRRSPPLSGRRLVRRTVGIQRHANRQSDRHGDAQPLAPQRGRRVLETGGAADAGTTCWAAPTEPAEEIAVFDELGAGIGSRIAISEGREAAMPFHPDEKPIDAYNAAILDHLVIESQPTISRNRNVRQPTR